MGLTTVRLLPRFTYTPVEVGAKTISVTNNGGLTDPANIAYTARTLFVPTDIAGLKLWLKADAAGGELMGRLVATWADCSGNWERFQPGATPLFKTNIVNG